MSVTAVRLARLSPGDRATFATSARLLSCLVTESLLRALYIPIRGFEGNGICVILNSNVSSEPPSPQPYTSKDIFAVIPLYDVPVFKHDGTDPRAKEISLLDPLDMMPLVFQVDPNGMENTDMNVLLSFSCQSPIPDLLFPQYIDLSDIILNVLSGPGWALSKSTPLFTSQSSVSLWEKFGMSIGLQDALLKEISAELESSVKWQGMSHDFDNGSHLIDFTSEHSYKHPPPAPQFTSPSIQWEQSIVEGHPTHPVSSSPLIISVLIDIKQMHKTRYFLPPLPDYPPGIYDLYHTSLRLIAVPKENLNITYDFEGYVQPILDAMSKKAGRPLAVCQGFVAIPVHELQVAHVQDKFSEAEIYAAEFSLPLLAQQSIRYSHLVAR